jgi:hypothetical protein
LGELLPEGEGVGGTGGEEGAGRREGWGGGGEELVEVLEAVLFFRFDWFEIMGSYNFPEGP